MAAESVKQGLIRFLEDRQPEIQAISRAIWEYAELAMQEERSSRELAGWLSRQGFEVRTGTSGMPTAFTAEFRQGGGKPVVAFLAEYDALPGNSNRVVPHHDPVLEGGAGHGCGHNLIGAGNAAAAVAVKDRMARAGIDGTVRVFGTPGEELLVGKVFMARDGLFDDCDLILTSHPASRTAASTAPCQALVSAEFRFRGQSAHPASAPEAARNALQAALHSIGTAELRLKPMGGGTVLEYVIREGGRQPNVTPDAASVWYNVRHPELRGAWEAYRKVVEAVQEASIAGGIRYQESFITGCRGYLANRRLAELLYENAAMVGHPTFSGEEKAFASELRRSYGLPAAEEPIHEGLDLRYEGLESYAQDDGDASWIAPLGRVNYAFPLGVPFHGWGFTAASGSSIGAKGMMFAAKTLGAAALDALLQPRVLETIKEEHRLRARSLPYRCLLPPDAKPVGAEFLGPR